METTKKVFGGIWSFIIVYFLAVMLVAMYVEFLSGVIVFLFFITVLLYKWRSSNVLVMMVYYFFSVPISAFIVVVMLISLWFHGELPSEINGLFHYFMLGFLPLLIPILLWAKWNNKLFIERAKYASMYMTLILGVMAACVLLYSYSTLNFDYLNFFYDLEALKENGIEERDAFQFLFSYLSFQYLVASAVGSVVFDHRLTHLNKNNR